MESVKVYLAGKIKKNDWRSGIVRDVDYDYDDFINGRIKWKTLTNGIATGVDYTGPFFVGCSHGCAHGKNSHGFAADAERHDDESFLRGCLYEFSPSYTVIKHQCLSAINRSDYVLAWIDSLDCFGTLFELGYAEAKRIKIVIGTSIDLSDLWFAITLNRIIRASTPVEFIQKFLEYLPKEELSYQEYIASDAWKKIADAAKNAAGHKCEICGRGGVLHAHHITYKNLGHETRADLLVLCPDCHAKEHGRESFDDLTATQPAGATPA